MQKRKGEANDNNPETPSEGVQPRSVQSPSHIENRIRLRPRPTVEVGGRRSVTKLREKLVKLAISYRGGSVFKHQDELHTFSPRKWLGIRSGQPLWRIAFPEEVDLFSTVAFDAHILKQRIELMKRSIELEEAFSSSPMRPPKYSVRFTTNSLWHCHVFRAKYAAARFVAMVIEGHKVKWLDRDLIELDNSMKLKSDDLEDLVEHEDNELEAKWVMPQPYQYYAECLNQGKSIGNVDWRTGEPLETRSSERRVERERPSREPRTSSPRASKEGLVTIADIAAELKLEPREARARLRKANVAKPGNAWAWPADEAEAIKAKLKR